MTPDPREAALETARSLELTLQALGHGLRALGQRIEGIEQWAADLQALARFLAGRPAHREPDRVAPVRRKAA